MRLAIRFAARTSSEEPSMNPNELSPPCMRPGPAGSRAMLLGVFLLGLILSWLLGAWLTPAPRSIQGKVFTVQGSSGSGVRCEPSSQWAATWRITDAAARNLVERLMEHAHDDPNRQGIHMLAACNETGLGSRSPRPGLLHEVLSPPGKDFCVVHLISAMTNLAADRRVMVMELLGEGLDWNAFWLGRGHETEKGDSLTELVVENATYFGNRLRESRKLAGQGMLIVNGCNAGSWRGQQSMPKLLADAAGCLVLAPGGYTIGSFSAGKGPSQAETVAHIEGTRSGSWGSTLHQRQQYYRYERVQTPLGIIVIEPADSRQHCEESQDDTFYLTTPAGYVWPAWLEDWRGRSLSERPVWFW